MTDKGNNSDFSSLVRACADPAAAAFRVFDFVAPEKSPDCSCEEAPHLRIKV